MASGWYEQGILKLINGTIDIDTSTIKVMLIKSTYVYDADQLLVDNGTADDLLSHELVATNYTGGFAGAGRKTGTVTLQVNSTDNRVDIAIADLTWTALGGAANDTIGFLAVIWETGAADTSAIPIAVLDVTNLVSNGGDVSADFTALGSGGNLRIAC